MGANTASWIGAGAGVLGGVMDIFNQNHNFHQQQQLMQQQFANQQALNVQGQMLQQQNWDYTNAENQVEHYKNAGLNVGLMYGGGGAGGATTGGASGGSASGGSAPQTASMQGMAMALGQQASQIELNKALANKANAEATKTGGVDTTKTTTEIANLEQGIQNQKASQKLTEMQTSLTGIEYDLKNATFDDSMKILKNEAIKGDKEIYILGKQGLIVNQEAINKTQEWKLKLAGMGIENALKEQLTEESRQKIKQQWRDLEIKLQNANSTERANEINEFKANLSSEYPGVTNTIGKVFNDLLGIGQSEENDQLHKKVPTSKTW